MNGCGARALLSAAALMAPVAAAATGTVLYSYDARGRLVGSFRDSGPSAGWRTRYGFDAANNRTQARSDFVLRWLNGGDALVSADQRFILIMQTDGNLVLYNNVWAPLWDSGTGGAGNRAQFQVDGNLVVLSPQDVPLWSSGSWGHPGSDLQLQNDGNIVIRDVTGTVVWTSGTGGN